MVFTVPPTLRGRGLDKGRPQEAVLEIRPLQPLLSFVHTSPGLSGTAAQAAWVEPLLWLPLKLCVLGQAT